MGLSSLTDPKAVIVADASAAINLNATGCAAKILRALPNRLVVVDIVFEELEEGRPRGRRDADLLAELMAAQLVESVRLGETGSALFERLVAGTAVDTLDDGEAASIAYAVEASAIALIDERKAARICSEQFPELDFGSTMDIVLHPEVERALGNAALADAVFNALVGARMRVLPEHLRKVVDLIGYERAALCKSLPARVRSGNK